MTSDVRRKTWSALSAYESVELVRRFAKERRGRDPGDKKAREIAAHFAQGREYFRGANGAGELVRPLILYYGVMSLARGAVLFLDSRRSKVVAGHGLEAAGWPDLNTKPEAVSELFITLKPTSTFPELARVTGNLERSTVRNEGEPGEVSVRSPGPELNSGTNIMIKEILGQIPDLAELYETTFREHSRRLRCEVLVTGIPEPDLVDALSRGEIPPDHEIKRHAWLGVVRSRAGLPSKDWVVEALGEERVRARETGENLLHFAHEARHRVGKTHLFDLFYDAGTEERPRLEMPLTKSASGEEYLKLPTERGILLSTLLALHLTAYAAGMLVRYHPGYWSMLAGRTKGDYVAPILAAAVATIEERYPTLLLDALGGL